MSPLSAFVRTLLLLMGFALAERILFAFHHGELSAGLPARELSLTLLVGLRFDLAIAAALTLLAYLPSYLLNRFTGIRFVTLFRALSYIAVATLVLVHGADLLYFGETGRHLGYEIKEAYQSGGELISTALATYTSAAVLQLILLAGAWGAVHLTLRDRNTNQRRMFAPEERWYQHLAPEARVLVVLVVSVVLTRGGLQPVPLEPLHAQALGNTHRAALALNGAYNALFSAVTPYAIPRVLSAAPSPEQQALVAAMYATAPKVEAANRKQIAARPAPVAPPNVVMVFLESWSASYMGSYGGDADTTPFFDQLRTRSLTTRELLAGGRRTTEGLFATLCSAQNPLGATVAQSQLQNYGYECLPQLLRKQGYRTAFFQGTVSGTSGTGAFAQLLGFEESYGKEHVTHHQLPHNYWGLHDPDLYAFTLDRLDKLTTPFLVGINTNSTHDFQLPPGAPAPFDTTTREGHYRNVLRFADGALGDFVTALMKRHPNTVLVLVADHAGPAVTGPTINHYRIPFLIHAPDRLAPAMLDGVATQRDVVPTLLQVLGLARAPWFTGRSLLEPHTLQADYYHGGILGWVENELGVEMPVQQPGDPRCFDTRNDFAALPCTERHQQAARHGMALTTVLQDLLFQGRLSQFRGVTASAP